jgi:MinD-like ATPase involved in chromosome partitioning or flagellar assembly
MLSGSIAEITHEKIQSSLVSHITGIKLLLASENPRDINLIKQVDNYEALVSRLGSLARFIVLDLGDGLPDFVQKLLPLCHERIVVLEGVAGTIRQTKILIDEIAALGIERKAITAVLNNRVRSETQMAWTDVQEKLGHTIATTLTPAPELFVQAIRMQSIAVLSQPTNVTSQQFLKIADLVLEHEKAG